MPPWIPSVSKFVTFYLAAQVIAQQQQSHDALRRSSPQENPALRLLTPNSHSKSLSKNERAVATVAPAAFDAAVRAPDSAKPAAGQASPKAGLSSRPGRARSLQDWEVENFVLLATVDGSIYARDRSSGQELWKFNTETPMVETIYHHRNHPDTADGKDRWMWIVEPNQDGSLYVFIPGPDAGIQKLGPTVKELADKLSPWVSEESPFVYTAEKRNTLITLNATNGVAIKYFSAGRSGFVDSRSCRSVRALKVEEEEECEPTPTINIGRTEYTVSIQDKDTGDGICTIKYYEWTPNKNDRDLHSQYSSTMDNKYIYTRHDGGIVALEYPRNTKKRDNQFLFSKKFASPVVRVFDVARPQGLDSREIPLVLLPQPVAPVLKPEEAENVFVNCTESGSWYALSESSYPTVTDGASEAKCYASPFSDDPIRPQQDSFKPSALVGVHSLSESNRKRQSVPSIGAPYDPVPVLEGEPVKDRPGPGHSKDTRYTIDPPKPASSGKGFNTATFAGGIFLLFVGIFTLKSSLNVPALFGQSQQLNILKRESIPERIPTVSVQESQSRDITSADFVPEVSANGDVAQMPLSQPLTAAEGTLSVVSTAQTVSVQPADTSVVENAVAGTSEGAQNDSQDGAAESPGAIFAEVVDQANMETKKKKTHRGTRGGRARKRNKAAKQKTDEEGVAELDKFEEINDAVRPETPQPASHNGLLEHAQDGQPDRIGDLTVYQDKVLGRGSGGTTVFEGSYGGRAVAVKRMLIQFYELASQEVTLLEQTDHHRNIVRYYSQQRDQHFLYIAVEKCRASLFDLYGNGPPMELESHHEQCRNEINFNVVGALRQLASGLKHLHSLRIIHRDIKPQNILVANPRPNEDLRLVISDFGLCRTLPEHASTLFGTAATGAGTSGWKAPELIKNPKEISTMSSTPDEPSNNSNEGSGSQGGVKRAVDIFSLGCVFYYILTNGHHPFDSESPGYYQWEREHRIRLGKSDFDKLTQMGADAEEPVHLIKWMVSHNPEDRPSAGKVLNHPFFWTPKQRLDFLCDVSDHWEREPRDPPSEHLSVLESFGEEVHGGNFLAKLDRKFIDTLGKQRKYTGDRMLDLLRALRNKKNHYADMPEEVQQRVGELPGGYLKYWTHRFPTLLISCYRAVLECELEKDPRFRPYLEDHSRD